MKLPPFSKLELADICQFPYTSGIRHSKFRVTPAAAFGRAAHSVGECIACWGDAPVGDIVHANELDQSQHEQIISAYVELSDQLNYEAQTDRWRVTEWRFGLQLNSGLVREVDWDKHRRRKNEIWGIIDLLREDGDGVLRIRDYKTGFGARWLQPLDTLQLLCYGLAAARFHKRDEVIVELCGVGEELKLESGVMDDFLLDWAWDRLHDIQSKVLASGNNVPRPGPHCRDMFCPIVDQCPATKKSLVAIDAASAIRMPLVAEIESDDHARYILKRLPAMKAALKKVEDAVRDRYTSRSLELEDGCTLAHWEYETEKVVISDDALRILNLHLNDGASNLVESKISRSAIRAMCKDVAPPRGGAALERALWADLKDVGAINTSKHTKFESRKKKKQDE